MSTRSSASSTVSALADSLVLLESYFAAGPPLECMDAADVDDSGTVSPLLDALYLLNYAFVDGDDIPAPTGDECDTDPPMIVSIA